MTPRRITILGESPLVEEYASLCLGKGFNVAVRINGEVRPKALAKDVKIVRTVPKATDTALELTNIASAQKRKNLVELDKALGPAVPILSSSVSVTVTQQSKWVSKADRLIGIGALPSLLAGPLIEFAPSKATVKKTITLAQEFAKALGKQSAVVRDRVGLILPGILCMLANEAYFALGEAVAIASDIDQAMKLGAHYPIGPVEWAEKIGLRQVRAVLDALNRQVDSKRYKVAPLLQQVAVKRQPVRSLRADKRKPA
jgi:3-hydroxybutyryl-CoA dehydrogenase